MSNEHRFLQAVLDGMGDGVVVCDKAGKLLLCNVAAKRLVGKGPCQEGPERWPDHYGLHMPDGLSPYPTQDLPLMRALQGEKVNDAEVLIRNDQRNDGVWVSANARALKNPTGGLMGAVVSFHEITGRKKEEERISLQLAQEQKAWKLVPPEFPLGQGFDLGGASHASRITTGDYFDYIQMQNGRIGVVIGSTTRPEAGPSMALVETRACLRTLARTRNDPGELLTLANQVLSEDFAEERAVKIFFGQFDPGSRSFVGVGAGLSAYLVGETGEVKVMEGKGPLLGSKPDTAYKTSSALVIEPTQILTMVTEGICNVTAPDGTRCGIERVLRLVRSYRGDPAPRLVANVYHGIRAFAHYAYQEEDITLIVLKGKTETGGLGWSRDRGPTS